MPATKSVALLLLVPPPPAPLALAFFPQHCFAPSEIMGQPTSPAVKKEGRKEGGKVAAYMTAISISAMQLAQGREGAGEDEFFQSLTHADVRWPD